MQGSIPTHNHKKYWGFILSDRRERRDAVLTLRRGTCLLLYDFFVAMAVERGVNFDHLSMPRRNLCAATDAARLAGCVGATDAPLPGLHSDHRRPCHRGGGLLLSATYPAVVRWEEIMESARAQTPSAAAVGRGEP